jgi:CHASE3 domain sensor protein
MIKRLRAMLGRIQSRLLVAFAIGFAGTLAIYVISVVSLNRFSDEVTDRLDEFSYRTNLGMTLEASLLDQIAAGHRYLLAPSIATAADFDTLGAKVMELHEAYSRLDRLSPNEKDHLVRISSLYDEVVAILRTARMAADSGNLESAALNVAAAEPGTRQLRATMRALNASGLRSVEDAF